MPAGLEIGADTFRPRPDEVSVIWPATVAVIVAGELVLRFCDRIRLESVPLTETSTWVSVPSDGSNWGKVTPDEKLVGWVGTVAV